MAEETAGTNENTIEEAVGIVMDHILTTKKLMESGKSPAYQSIVPLKGSEKPLPDSFITRLYEVLQRSESPYLEQAFPYYYKNEQGELIEGEQNDKRYKTKLEHVNVSEVADSSGKVLEAHVVIGPIKGK